MIIQTTFTSVYEDSDRKNRQGSEQTDFVVWQKLAWTVARRYCHCLCDSFVFSKQAIIDVSERILGISVTEALRKFDPSKGAKFTTFLYRILKFHAIKEYLAILKNVQADGVIVDYDSDAMNEVEIYAEKGFEHIDTMDMINFCVTIPDEELASIKRQYLPKPLQNLPDEPLRRSLSDLDREIFERLVTNESQHEIRHDIERRWASGTEHRKFFHSRCKAIARRGKIE